MNVPDRRKFAEMNAALATRKTPPKIVSVCGLIGAGKSTILKSLKNTFEANGMTVQLIPEPVDIWNSSGALEAFYKNPEGKALEFQTFVAVTRMIKFLEALIENPHADVYISERSMIDDKGVFVETGRKLLGEMRVNMYETWWDAWRLLVPFDPTHHVFIKPSIEKCMERVQIRARDGETGETGGVSLAYQEQLMYAHETLYENLHAEDYGTKHFVPHGTVDPTTVLVINGEDADGDYTPHGDQKTIDSITGKVYRFVSGCEL